MRWTFRSIRAICSPALNNLCRVPIGKLRELESQRLISIQQHPAFPLLIHNYTQSCQFEKAWNDLTVMCRGLITDLDGLIVARPFRKFFNLAEHNAEGSKLPPSNGINRSLSPKRWTAHSAFSIRRQSVTPLQPEEVSHQSRP